MQTSYLATLSTGTGNAKVTFILYGGWSIKFKTHSCTLQKWQRLHLLSPCMPLNLCINKKLDKNNNKKTGIYYWKIPVVQSLFRYGRYIPRPWKNKRNQLVPSRKTKRTVKNKANPRTCPVRSPWLVMFSGFVCSGGDGLFLLRSSKATGMSFSFSSPDDCPSLSLSSSCSSAGVSFEGSSAASSSLTRGYFAGLGLLSCNLRWYQLSLW